MYYIVHNDLNDEMFIYNILDVYMFIKWLVFFSTHTGETLFWEYTPFYLKWSQDAKHDSF